MDQSKLILLLRTFESRQFGKFMEFLRSPYFNKRTELIDFYQVLKEYAPEFEPERISKEQIWQQYAPEKALNEKELGYLMTFLLKLAEQFIVIERETKEEIGQQLTLVNHYLEAGLHKNFRSTLSKTKKHLENSPWRDANWNLHSWRLADAEMQYFYSTHSRKQDDSILRASQHLDTFYLVKKLELASEIQNLNQILQADLPVNFIPDLLTYMATISPDGIAIQIRQLILQILQNPSDTQAFRTLKSYLPEAPSTFPPDKVKGIFAYAQNFSIRQVKAGNQAFLSELFSLYKMSLQQGVMLDDGVISPWTFKNVTSVALRLEAYDWARQFIQKYGHKIEAEFRPSAIAYNQANLHFHEKSYDLALKSLMKVEFSDIFYALDTRRMMLMIYFERADYEAMASLISSFRIFLRRNRVISETNRIAYKHFIDWLARIFRATSRQEAPWEKFIAEIIQTQPIVEGEWLCQKCRELI